MTKINIDIPDTLIYLGAGEVAHRLFKKLPTNVKGDIIVRVINGFIGKYSK